MAKVKPKEKQPKKKQTLGMKILTVVFSVISIFYVSPLFIVLMNSFKFKTDISDNPFAFPNAETFYGFQNYIKGMTFGNFSFWKVVLTSLFITIGGVFLILLCTSMTAWPCPPGCMTTKAVMLQELTQRFVRLFTTSVYSQWLYHSRWLCTLFQRLLISYT